MTADQPGTRRDRRLAVLPDRWFPHGWGAATWWVTGIAFMALTIAVARGATASWDAAVTAGLVQARTLTLTRVAVAVSWLGSAAALVVWAGAAAALLDRRYGTAWRCLLRVALVLLLDVAVVFAIKTVVQRPRPPSELWLVSVSTFSFPSGHVTATTAAVSMLGLCLLALPSSRRARTWAVLAGTLAVAAMAWSRMYLGVHFLSDVAAGTLLGVWLALSTLWSLDAVARTPGQRRATT